MSHKKGHHYLPKCYLKGFCDNKKKLWVYEKDTVKEPYTSTPDKVAKCNNLYMLYDSKDPIELEDFLANKIEGPAAMVLSELREKRFPDIEQKYKLALFIAILMVRTPRYISYLDKISSDYITPLCSSIARDRERFNTMRNKSNKNLSKDTIEQDRNSILKEEFSFKLNHDLILRNMLIIGEAFAQVLVKTKWLLLETGPEFPFITTDNLINIDNLNNLSSGIFKPGMGFSGAMCALPISKDLTLIMLNHDYASDDKIINIKDKKELKKLIMCLNKQVYLRAEKFVFASEGSDKLRRCFQNLNEKTNICKFFK